MKRVKALTDATQPATRRAAAALAWLKRRGTRRNVDGMAQYGIRSTKAFGVSMATMRPLVTALGRNHDLAAALWETGWLEARVLASFVDEPAKVTPRQIEAWAGEFDNWAICDSSCIHLFVHTPHAWAKARTWSRRKQEFVRRAAFATMAGLAVHDKKASDDQFIALLPLIEAAADDDRNFVKKAVNWALRQIGKRNLALNAAAIDLAQRLVMRPKSSARWIGHDALRELTSATVQTRLRSRARKGDGSRAVAALLAATPRRG